MELSGLNVFLLSTYSSAPPAMRQKLEGFGVESFGLYHSYSQFKEVVSGMDESCLVIDLLGSEGEKFNLDFGFFFSQASPFPVAQALRWKNNNGEIPLVEIDSNFRIMSEEKWESEEAKDGLVRMPLYFFSNGEVNKYVTDEGINLVGENWYGIPVGTSRQELGFHKKKPALFLDRDGVINVDHGFVYLHKDIEYREEIFPIIKMFNDRFWPVFVLTNQSGIATGKYGEEDVLKLHEQMALDLEQRDLKIEEWVYSPYHEDKGQGTYKRRSFTRKPGSGMALKVLEEHAIDIENSFMIGDKATDNLLLPGLTTLLIRGNYDLKNSKCQVFDSLSEIENFIRELI